jgi:hypothetical protein
MKATKTLAATLLAAGLLTSAAPAGAGATDRPSATTSVGLAKTGISGKVRSSSRLCLANRKVSLLQFTDAGRFRVVYRATTRDDGSWRVGPERLKLQPSEGGITQIQAFVSQVTVGSLTCREDKSDVVVTQTL